MHLVLLLEILKPFFTAHFNILLMHCCIFLSVVTMFLELKQGRKSSAYNKLLISEGRQVVILFILIMNRITDRILL